MMSDPTALRLEPDVLAGLDRLGEELGRSREELISEAVRKFVDDELAFSRFMQAGESDFAKGDYLTHDELMVELRADLGHKDAA